MMQNIPGEVTFGLQPESSTNMFHISGYFCIVCLGVYESAYT